MCVRLFSRRFSVVLSQGIALHLTADAGRGVWPMPLGTCLLLWTVGRVAILRDHRRSVLVLSEVLSQSRRYHNRTMQNVSTLQ